MNGKANSGHTHDDRYFTESEITTKLNGKANSSHTHDDIYYTESEIDTKFNKLNSDLGNITKIYRTTTDKGANLTRVGNVVFLDQIRIAGGVVANFSYQNVFIGTIPVGYRPSRKIYSTQLSVTGYTTIGSMRHSIEPSGDTFSISDTSYDHDCEYNVSIAWITEEAYPSN